MKIEKYYNLTADVPYERVSKERILTGFNDLDYFTKGMGVGVTLLVANTNAERRYVIYQKKTALVWAVLICFSDKYPPIPSSVSAFHHLRYPAQSSMSFAEIP